MGSQCSHLCEEIAMLMLTKYNEGQSLSTHIYILKQRQ